MRTLALIALACLLFAGSVQVENSSSQPSCVTGDALGFATIKPFPVELAGQITGNFSRDERWFLRRFNCTGGSVEVRRLGTGVYDLRFPGLNVRAVGGVGLAETQLSASMQPLGSVVRIRLFSGSLPDDSAFSVIVH